MNGKISLNQRLISIVTFQNPFPFQIKAKAESSKAVNHLPMSSQLEYHRLLSRMKLLEKQKEQKSRMKKQTIDSTPESLPVKPDSNYPKLTVVIQNENRFIQTNKAVAEENDAKPIEEIKVPAVTKVLTNKLLSTTSNTSLAKKVLVKNAMAQATDIPKLSVIKSTNVTPAIALSPVTGEQSLNSAADSQSTTTTTTESKPISTTLAIIEKKSPKDRASLLANYIKKYQNHGCVIFYAKLFETFLF